VLIYILLLGLGFGVGAIGTLIGAGGGFILVPVLLLAYPTERPELITSTSLAVVFANALSGSVAYARMKRIDYRSGIYFALATIPGAVVGAMTTEHIPRQLFNTIMGVLLIGVASFLFVFPTRRRARPEHPAEVLRPLTSFKIWIGVGLSFFVGFLASLLGIGGGIIHVPALIHLLEFPVHVATATSHFILAVTALSGTIVHIVDGSFEHGALRVVAIAIGTVIGAQFGAKLSTRVHGKWIVRGLAIAIGSVGIRLIVLAFQ
jgi:uncharacterized membrane protein YfcA